MEGHIGPPPNSKYYIDIDAISEITRFEHFTSGGCFGRQPLDELILMCLSVRNMPVISEIAYSSQSKLIGHSRHVWEHGIGSLNLAFDSNNGRKRLLFGFKLFKPRRTKNLDTYLSTYQTGHKQL